MRVFGRIRESPPIFRSLFYAYKQAERMRRDIEYWMAGVIGG